MKFKDWPIKVLYHKIQTPQVNDSVQSKLTYILEVELKVGKYSVLGEFNDERR